MASPQIPIFLRALAMTDCLVHIISSIGEDLRDAGVSNPEFDSYIESPLPSYAQLSCRLPCDCKFA